MESWVDPKKAFTVIGYGIDIAYDQCNAVCPEFWKDFSRRKNPLQLKGMFGVCMMHEDHMHYMIADVYLPWMKLDDELETAEIPSSDWVIFPVHGALPDSLQKVNSEVWNSWVPAHQKDLPTNGSLMLEMYMPPVEDMSQYYCELWLPLQKK